MKAARLAGLAATAVVAMASCSGSSDPAEPPLSRCIDPPASALAEQSELVLGLTPNPIVPGGRATLSVESADVAANGVGGAGAAWQCWTGERWESTHQILRPLGEGLGEARYIEPGTEPTVPAIGLIVPNSYEVVIPEVPTGTYRISDDVWSEGRRLVGFVVVVVEETADSD